ncbi:Ribosomal RNA small subunit methyltransferase E [Pirellulimonas nuda]|uniref:Ribosomal RNA small subunit methyltransferase E n=1 Tax=Pirellulimonas nuda TaxID=2528009 RepID=A0A518D5B4_9BACT|nr:16S rRNA (uracil(1498)-N(3))-methyltransferase [Pirellulimonas nuda]QDU86670.1 Ribosomal RNA small subunit methyltransferase E [Pirellulimonas nuda]
MPDRYFSETPIEGPLATLAGSEAHHLLHVMRAGPGDRVTLFDGAGAEFDAEVQTLARATATLRVLERREVSRESARELVLAVAIPKGDRQKWLVEKLTELGVTSLVPLLTERSVVRLAGSALDKLRRNVVEASKQCGRNRLMEITAPRSWNECIEGFPEHRRLVAHPGVAAGLTAGSQTPTVVAVGPEGGLTDHEVELAQQHGWRPIALGPRILRIETAAIAAATLVALADGGNHG